MGGYFHLQCIADKQIKRNSAQVNTLVYKKNINTLSSNSVDPRLNHDAFITMACPISYFDLKNYHVRLLYSNLARIYSSYTVQLNVCHPNVQLRS